MDLAESLDMKDAKGVSTPHETASFNFRAGVLLESTQQYRGNFQASLSMMFRLGISAAVGILCRKTNLPNHYDLNAVKRLSRYLKGTADLKLKI